ncbi:MAG: Eco57I restriction-modification methylase domain-containing protein [Chloroflexi bacterium]|nr:Eco57I restriction-modification methylase domain-containing protein [Chloroflexota bacterium]
MRELFPGKLEALAAQARRLLTAGFGQEEPEEATKSQLIEPVLEALGYERKHQAREFKILGDSVDYCLRNADRPLFFLEAKSLHDCPDRSLFDKHREQVRKYLRHYRISPEQVKMEQPVTWLVLTNFAQWHFIRVTDEQPAFSFDLKNLLVRRDELWDLLARENVEAGRIEELYDQQHKAGLDQQFLADLKLWRLILANAFALRTPALADDLARLALVSQQLLDRLIFTRMLETWRLTEWNKLARAFVSYDTFFGEQDSPKPFAEFLRESLFAEIKDNFNTELFEQPLLCDGLPIDNQAIAVAIGHEPLAPEIAAQCGLASGQGEAFAFRHLYSYDFSRMSHDIMGSVYERFLAHRLLRDRGRIVIEDTDELRKKEGIYYTPQYIVDYLVEQTVGQFVKPVLDAALRLVEEKRFSAAAARIRELSQIKVLDPAMGSGSFLLRAFDFIVAAYERYNAAARAQKNGLRVAGELHDAPPSLFNLDAEIPEEIFEVATHVLLDNIFGVDLDPQAVELARMSLWLRVLERDRYRFRDQVRSHRRSKRALKLLPGLKNNLKRGNSLITDAAVAGESAFDWQKEFPQAMGGTGQWPAPPSGRGFHVVIGNPPYERIQTMTGNSPSVVEFLRANYRSASSGNFDIYVCFIERGLQLLRAGGHFGYICPHKFFQAEYGREVRKLLTEGRHVRQIVSFGDQQIFPQATTYTCLLLLDQQPQHAPIFIKVDDLNAWRSSGEAAQGRITPASFGEDQWNFVLGNGAELFAKLNQQPLRLRDVAERMAQGLRTSANAIYVLDRVSADRKTVTAYSEQLQREVKLEFHAVLPFLQGRDIRRYVLEPSGKVVVMPYRVKAGRAELMAEAELRKKFPLAYGYLRENKKLLEEREEGRMRGEEWYAFIYPKNIELMSTPKILVPDIADFASFAFDADGAFAFTTGYGITLKQDALESPAYLLGLLNSRLLDFYLKQVSTPLRGGYFRYFTQFIEQLPVKRVDPRHKRQVRLANEISGRVDAIQAAHRQRLALPAVLDRKIRHSPLRSPCSLSHYLQKDYAGAVKAEPLLDDVQRRGFVHRIKIEAENGRLMLSAAVADDAKAEPKLLSVLRLTFQHEPLRQFTHAMWRRFLDENSRRQKWTAGKKPDEIYTLLVNTLEPLVSFHAAATDNLRAIHELMEEVTAEAGTADLAAVEADIVRLDQEINGRVYELYELTPAEIRLVEQSG